MSQPMSFRFKIKRQRDCWVVVDTRHGRVAERRRTLDAAQNRADELNQEDTWAQPSVFDSDDIRRMEEEAREELAREQR